MLCFAAVLCTAGAAQAEPLTLEFNAPVGIHQSLLESRDIVNVSANAPQSSAIQLGACSAGHVTPREVNIAFHHR